MWQLTGRVEELEGLLENEKNARQVASLFSKRLQPLVGPCLSQLLDNSSEFLDYYQGNGLAINDLSRPLPFLRAREQDGLLENEKNARQVASLLSKGACNVMNLMRRACAVTTLHFHPLIWRVLGRVAGLESLNPEPVPSMRSGT